MNLAQSIGATSAPLAATSLTSHIGQAEKNINDSKVLASAVLKKPHTTVDIWEPDINGESIEARLWEAWQMYTAKDEVESSLSSDGVRAYNTSERPHFDSLQD